MAANLMGPSVEIVDGNRLEEKWTRETMGQRDFPAFCMRPSYPIWGRRH